jgi:hypothetical protein
MIIMIISGKMYIWEGLSSYCPDIPLAECENLRKASLTVIKTAPSPQNEHDLCCRRGVSLGNRKFAHQQSKHFTGIHVHVLLLTSRFFICFATK